MHLRVIGLLQFHATKSDKNRRFNASWLSRFPGLVYDRQVDGDYCLQCSLFDTGNPRMLVREPFRNWRKGIGKFNEHFHNVKSEKSKTSTGHQLHMDNKLRAEKFLSNFANGDSVILQLDKGLKARHDVNVKKLSSIVSTVLFCGRQGIALRGHFDDPQYFEDPNINCGNFQALLDFRIDAGDSILKTHFETAPRNATYRSMKIQNELISNQTGHCKRYQRRRRMFFGVSRRGARCIQ